MCCSTLAMLVVPALDTPLRKRMVTELIVIRFHGWSFPGRGALRVHVSCNDPLGSGARSRTSAIGARRPSQADCQ